MVLLLLALGLIAIPAALEEQLRKWLKRYYDWTIIALFFVAFCLVIWQISLLVYG